MGLVKIATLCAASAVAISTLPQEADAHAFLLLPKADFTTDKKNFYAYVVDGNKVPPFSSYITGDAEKNSKGFTANYKKLKPPSLKEFILKNQEPAKGADIPPGGTAECGFSKPDIAPQPIPDHIEFGNYNLQISGGLHPGPCEAWCDDEIVVPFTEDCRARFQKPIPYDKTKCIGKKRLTFYWLATHFAPFQVYIGCAPLQGAKPSNGNGNVAGEANNTTPAASKPVAAPTPLPAPKPASSSSAPSAAPSTAPAPKPSAAPAPAAPSKCGVKRS